ncbi:MAG: bifunctional transaldolase/phosoglucose isomerase, partial [Proteobacteria bacterium]|nr:bifunctional transaldolase/phosoglucose isomerase [Pseudomonadota bacterium]
MSGPLGRVIGLGQSIWYDNLCRSLVTSGELARMVEADGLGGVTSNPAIFQKALSGSDEYDDELRALVARDEGDAKALYEALAVRDIQLAADVLRPAYDAAGGRDGFVSLEVSPHLAADTAGTVEEARRLSSAVDRPNLLIKVPATPEGIPAIEQLISEGIGVNVTLLFSVGTYDTVAAAYLSGLEALAERGGELGRVASVASFFVSRIDAKVDARLDQEAAESGDPERKARLEKLAGRVAIANAKRAYALYEKLVASPRWQALEARGAQRQRLLWASTGTKNPAYPPTLYVDELIGPETVNTLPVATYDTFKQQGRVRNALVEGASARAEAEEHLRGLDELGISLDEITDELRVEGVRLFADAFDQLLAAMEEKRRAFLGPRLARQNLGAAEAQIAESAETWRREGRVRRLWSGDASLWTDSGEDRWLGWLRVVQQSRAQPEALDEVAAKIAAGDFEHVLVLGMGGSSLWPDVLGRTFGRRTGFPALRILDSTVPAQVRRITRELDLSRTLFLIASKSGGTIEPNVALAHFLEEATALLGREEARRRVVAITDPGSSLEALAQRDGFLAIAYGDPEIGGRFSGLSPFGMLPARAMGLDVADFLARTEQMIDSCGPSVPPAQNPGVALGLALAALAREGRDKLTLVTSPGLTSLGGWIEQLVAESTGKDGVGITVVDGEGLGAPDVYGADRVFASITLRGEPDARREAALSALEGAGNPVFRIELEDTRQLGQELFRWEMATAVAGAELDVNPFDQPDVEAAKLASRELMEAYEESGSLPEPTARLHEAGMTCFADDALPATATAGELLAAHLARIGPGDSFAINAYLDMNADNERELQALRLAVRDATRAAT